MMIRGTLATMLVVAALSRMAASPLDIDFGLLFMVLLFLAAVVGIAVALAMTLSQVEGGRRVHPAPASYRKDGARS